MKKFGDKFVYQKTKKRKIFKFYDKKKIREVSVKHIPHEIPMRGINITISNKEAFHDIDNIKYISDFDIENTWGTDTNFFSSDVKKNSIINISAATGRYGECEIFEVKEKNKNMMLFFVNNLRPYWVIETALNSKKKKFYKLLNITDNKLLVYFNDEINNYIRKTKNFENLFIDEYSSIPEGTDLTISVTPKFKINKIFDLTDRDKAQALSIKPLDASIKYQHLEWKIKNNKISSFTLKGLNNEQTRLILTILKKDKVKFKMLKHGYIDEKNRNKPSINDINKNISIYFKETKKSKRSLEIKIPNGVYALKYLYDYKHGNDSAGMSDAYLGCWLEKIKDNQDLNLY